MAPAGSRPLTDSAISGRRDMGICGPAGSWRTSRHLQNKGADETNRMGSSPLADPSGGTATQQRKNKPTGSPKRTRPHPACSAGALQAQAHLAQARLLRQPGPSRAGHHDQDEQSDRPGRRAHTSSPRSGRLARLWAAQLRCLSTSTTLHSG